MNKCYPLFLTKNNRASFNNLTPSENKFIENYQKTKKTKTKPQKENAKLTKTTIFNDAIKVSTNYYCHHDNYFVIPFFFFSTSLSYQRLRVLQAGLRLPPKIDIFISASQSFSIHQYSPHNIFFFSHSILFVAFAFHCIFFIYES